MNETRVNFKVSSTTRRRKNTAAGDFSLLVLRKSEEDEAEHKEPRTPWLKSSFLEMLFSALTISIGLLGTPKSARIIMPRLLDLNKLHFVL